MRQLLHKLLLMTAMLVVPWVTQGQDTVSLPYSTTFDSVGQWQMVSGTQTNHWAVVDSMLTVTSNGTTRGYNTGSTSFSYARLWVSIPTAGAYIVQYTWNGIGEGSWDYARMFLAPATATLTPGQTPGGGTSSYTFGTTVPAGWLALDGARRLNGSSASVSETSEINIAIPGVYQVVVLWCNDGSGGTMPPTGIDNFSFAENTCPSPTNVAITTAATTATLTWTGSVSSYVLEYDIQTFVPGSGAVSAQTVNDTTVTLTGLTANTTYYYYLRSDCGVGDTSLFVSGIFRTTPDPNAIATVPYYTDFSTDDLWIYESGTQTNHWANIDGMMTITSDDSTRGYNTSRTSYSYVWMPIHFEDAGAYVMEFIWNGVGEGGWDRAQVYLVPFSTTVTAGIQAPSSWIHLDGGRYLSGSAASQTSYTEFNITDTGMYKIVLYWKNDGSGGTMPPTGIDTMSIYHLTCPRPVNIVLNGSDTNSLTVAWTERGSATSWQLQWDTVAFADSITPMGVQTVSDTFYTITDLQAARLYYVRVQSDCSSEQSNWSDVTSFYTACYNMLPIPFDYGFENLALNQQPFCGYHGSYSASTNYPYGSSTAATGSRSLYMYSYFSSSSSMTATYYAVGPVDTLENAMNTLQSRCKVKSTSSSTGSSYPATLLIGVMSDPSDLSTFYPMDTVTANYNNWTEVEVSFGDLPDSVYGSYVAFVSRPITTSSYAYNYVVIDDIHVGIIPTCERPNDLVCTAHDTANAILHWIGVTDGSYEIVWDLDTVTNPDQVSDDGINILTTSDDTITITGLMANQSYNVWIRTTCSDGNSEWRGPIVVRTFQEYSMPATGDYTLDNACGYMIYDNGGPDASYSPNANSTLVLTPTPGNVLTIQGTFHLEGSYDWLKIYDGTTTSSNMVYSTSGTTLGTIPLLESASGHFTLQFHSDGSVNNSGFELQVGCQSMGDCLRPSDLQAMYPTSDQMTLFWTETGEATQWNVVYDSLPIADSLLNSYNSTQLTTNPATITGLLPNTTYYFYLQADCGSEQSIWTRPAVGTTGFDCGDSLSYGFAAFTGTTTSTLTPVYSSYGSSMSQTIYTAQELQEQGVYRGYLRKMKLEWVTASSYPKHQSIYLASTSQDGFTSSTSYVPASDFQRVWDSSNNQHAVGVETFTFDSAFYWDGISNICVMFISNHNGTTGTTSASGHSAKVMAGPSNSTIYRYVDNATFNLTNLTTTGYSSSTASRPAWTFEGCVDVPACPTPRNIAAARVDSSSADITWYEPGSATTWNVVYTIVPTDSPDTVPTMLTVTDTAHLTNLEVNTVYYVYVRSLCGNDTSTWSRAYMFRTECGRFILPFTEDFDSYAQYEHTTCWTSSGYQSGANMYPYIYTYYHHSGANSYYMYNNVSYVPTMYVSPEIDTNAWPINTLMTNFWLYASSYNAASYPGTLIVGVMSNPADITTFYPVDTVTPGVASQWVELEVSFGNLPDSIHAAHIAYISKPVNYTASYAYNYLYLDDVTIDTLPSCPRPTSLEITGVQGDTVYLHWNPSTAGSTYQVVYGLGGINPDTVTVNSFGSLTGDSLMITGLAPYYSYDFYVRTDCSTEYSEWRGPVSAIIMGDDVIVMTAGDHDTTTCNVIITDDGGLSGNYSNNFDGTYTVYPSGNNYLVVSGHSYLEGIDHIYIYQGATATGTALYTTPSSTGENNFGPFAMEPGEPVTIKFHSDASVVYSGFEIAVGCISEGSCARVNRLAGTNATSTSIDVDWNDRGNTYAGYIVEYGTVGFTPGTGTALHTTSHPVTITGISASYEGEIRVRAICGVGDTAAWSSPLHFTTTQIPATVPYLCDFDASNDWANWQQSTNPASSARWTRGTFGQPSVPGSQNGIFVTFDDSTAHYVENVSNVTAYRDVNFGSNDTSFIIGFDAQMGGSITNRYDGLMVFLADAGVPVISSDANITTPWGNVNSLYRIANVRRTDLVDSAWTHFEGTFDGLSGIHRVAFFWFHQGASTNFVGEMAQVDNISVNYASCPRPYNLQVANVTSSTATITWDGLAAGNYSVIYRVAGADASTNTWVSTVTNSVTLTGLSDVTQYYVWVVRNCSATDTSLVSDGISFTTTICDDFNSYNAYDTNAVQGTSSYFPAYSFYNYGFTEVIIDSATIAASGLTVGDPIEGFEYNVSNATGGNQFNNCHVYMKPTTKTAFTGTSDWDTVSSSDLMFSGDLNCDATGWRLVRFDTTYIWDGQSILIAIDRDNGTYASGFNTYSVPTTGAHLLYSYSDSYNYDPLSGVAPTSGTAGSMGFSSVQPVIRFFNCGVSNCHMPEVTNTSTTYQSSTIAWNSDASDFEVNIKAVSAPEWPATNTAVNGTTYTFAGLQPATTYLYRLRAVCDSVTTSDWYEGRFLTDSLPCFAPSTLTANEGFGSAELNWTAGSNETQWRVHVWNTTFDSVYIANAKPYTATGLTSGTQYHAAVAAVCGGGLIVSDYSSPISFTTEVCAVPTGLATSNVTTNSVHVTWNAGANNTGKWIVEYGVEGYVSGQGTEVTVTSASADLTGLESELTYDVYVRAVCDDAYPSGWSNKASFTTHGVGIDNVGASHVTLFPNPAANSTTVSVNGVEGMVTITVVDMNGRAVRTETVECSSDCTKTMDIDSLAAGAYFVRIQGGGINVVKKLVVK